MKTMTYVSYILYQHLSSIPNCFTLLFHICPSNVFNKSNVTALVTNKTADIRFQRFVKHLKSPGHRTSFVLFCVVIKCSGAVRHLYLKHRPMSILEWRPYGTLILFSLARTILHGLHVQDNLPLH